jgi:hypothetical protein
MEDPIVRRLVRLAVHVRGYLPYYLVTIALLAVVAFVPRPGGGSDDLLGANNAATAAGPAARGASTPAGGARAGAAGAGALAAAADASLLGGAAGASDLGAGAVDASAVGFLAGDAAATAVPEAPAAPAAPEAPDASAPDFSGFDDVTSADEPAYCTVSAPSPAPSVTPYREIDGAQGTVEAAARTELPASAAPYVEDAFATAGCPDTSGLPAVPAPPVGLPV